MKAAQIKEYGGVENIELVEVDTPVPQAGQVQVEVYAASLNPFDSIVRQGHARQMAELPMPATLGGDFAGVVSAVGEGVTAFTVGDKVYGSAQALAGNSGALAEYTVTGVDNLAIAPSNITLREAASLPLVGASAIQAIKEHMELTSGQKLFVQGGSGGIGTVAIQIAKNLGAYVAASSKTAGVDYVKGFGTDEVVDVQTQDFTTVLRDYDAELVLVGGEDWGKLLSVVKDGGVVVSLVGPADEQATSARSSVTVYPQGTHTNTKWLDEIRGLVESGVVTPQVAKTFSLDQIKDAFTTREAGGVTGKVVIEIKQ